jgi:hypothetical protein
MLTQLTTVKQRLDIALSDVTHDEILTRAIEAVGARFDRECNRTLARTVNAEHEFCADEIEIPVACYPIEDVIRFEVKSTQADGWIEQGAVDYVIRRKCVVSLAVPLSPHPPSTVTPVARVVYTGGFVLPGEAGNPGSTGLPADLESAAVEQVAAWFQQRDKLGVVKYWPTGGPYLSFEPLPMLPQVVASLRPHRRWVV